MQHNDELRLTFVKQDPQAEINTTRSWRGVSVQYSRLKLPVEFKFEWGGESHYLAHHDLVLHDGELEVEGEVPVAGGDIRDKMTYVPQGASSSKGGQSLQIASTPLQSSALIQPLWKKNSKPSFAK